jgi:thiol:disulfide interchange protein DsbD
MRPAFAAVIALLLALTAGAAVAQPSINPHVRVELVAETAGAAPGSTLYAAVVLTAEKGWHTYWRNPGDAGEAPKIVWSLPSGWKAGDIVWPTPKRLPVGPIMNYGYEGRVLLAAPIEVPAQVKPGVGETVGAKIDYLVCAEVCVPGAATVSLAIPVVAGKPALDSTWGRLIEADLAAAPKPAGLSARFQRLGPRLALAVAGPALAGAAPAEAYFFPYDDSLIDQSKPQTAVRGPKGLTLSLTPGTAFAGGGPRHAAGVLAIDDAAYEIDAAPGPAPAGAAGMGALSGGASALGLPLAIVLAFAGGVILNLMPCVFPILSMKAVALARHGGEGARAEGVAFFIGVLVAFLLLAGALIAARTAGEAAGWGFQLQAPLNVALLCLVMLGAALNLSGLFEIGVSAQGLGSAMLGQGRILGSLLTGALAVVVAAPCTAPFMGPALGFALTQAPGVALAVFASLAAGFAAPYTAIALTPALTRRLPKPGAWMEGLKKALAFPMYGAAAWLLWVLSQQTGPLGLARLLAAAVALAFGAWLFGVGQRRRASGAGGLWTTLGAAAGLALAIALVSFGPFEPAAAAGARGPAGGALASTPYSPDGLAALRAARTPVLVNFTAAWCVTCQVNERVAFSSAEVAAAMKRAGVTYMVADWTNRDPAIAKALAAEGRIGVPLYLYYPPGARRPIVLPQLLTPGLLAAVIAGRSNG